VNSPSDKATIILTLLDPVDIGDRLQALDDPEANKAWARLLVRLYRIRNGIADETVKP